MAAFASACNLVWPTLSSFWVNTREPYFGEIYSKTVEGDYVWPWKRLSLMIPTDFSLSARKGFLLSLVPTFSAFSSSSLINRRKYASCLVLRNQVSVLNDRFYEQQTWLDRLPEREGCHAKALDIITRVTTLQKSAS